VHDPNVAEEHEFELDYPDKTHISARKILENLEPELVKGKPVFRSVAKLKHTINSKKIDR